MVRIGFEEGVFLISEALYLRKPVLSIPVRRQYEQISNGICVARAGYGMTAAALTPETLKEFLRGLGAFRKNLRDYKRINGAPVAARLIESMIVDRTT